jgi:hypothetical protein
MAPRGAFRLRTGLLWHQALSRRSQNGHVRWDRMRRLIDLWLPPAHISSVLTQPENVPKMSGSGSAILCCGFTSVLYNQDSGISDTVVGSTRAERACSGR